MLFPFLGDTLSGKGDDLKKKEWFCRQASALKPYISGALFLRIGNFVFLFSIDLKKTEPGKTSFRALFLVIYSENAEIVKVTL